MQYRRGEGGFTLLELMIVVAIIAVLAVIVIPSWVRDSHKSTAKSEVAAVFAELMTKEEQYKIDNGVYIGALVCPITPSPVAQDVSACVATGTTWAKMRVALPTTFLYCTYQITSGKAGTTPAPPAPFTIKPAGAQPVNWYFIVATCNMSGKLPNATYFTSSVDVKYQSANEGQ